MTSPSLNDEDRMQIAQLGIRMLPSLQAKKRRWYSKISQYGETETPENP
jgi:hypothetical protein